MRLAPLQSEHHLTHPKYRPDIDGLRAIAVLSVVIFHAFPKLLRGGFIGVDIFFVISGFLISTIIMSNLERNSFNFVEFYSRRIKRIFPALILVLTACFAFGWFVLLADEYKQLGKHIAGGAGFISNFLFWNESGYFDNAAETKPLLHLWSLGIEEQFYIVWPLLLWIVWKKNFNLLTITIIVAFISFALNIRQIRQDEIATFYSPQTRFWELLLGSVLAHLTLHRQNIFPKLRCRLDGWLGKIIYTQSPEANGKPLNNVQSLLGAFFILVGVLITRERHFPGWWALLPTLGAVLIISAGTHAWFNRVVLSSKVLVWLGLISFPLYLWHWPLLSFAQIMESGTPSHSIRLAAIVIAIVLAWLTYHFIERPIRFGKKTWIKTAVLSMVLAFVGYAGYNTFQRDGLKFRTKQLIHITKASSDWDYPGKLLTGNLDDIQYFYQNSGRSSITLFVGDSNVEQYFPRAEALIANDPNGTNGIIFKTGAGCLSIPEQPHDVKHNHCLALMQNALKIAEENPEVDTVVIGSQWNGHLSNGIGSTEYVDALKKLGGYIKELRELNKRVFLILNIPTGVELDPKFMIKRNLKTFPRVLSIQSGGIARVVLEKAYGQVQADLAQVAANAGATVISPMDSLCEENCPGVDAEGEPIYKDGYHLRSTYVRRKADFIDVTMQPM